MRTYLVAAALLALLPGGGHRQGLERPDHGARLGRALPCRVTASCPAPHSARLQRRAASSRRCSARRPTRHSASGPPAHWGPATWRRTSCPARTAAPAASSSTFTRTRSPWRSRTRSRPARGGPADARRLVPRHARAQADADAPRLAHEGAALACASPRRRSRDAPLDAVPAYLGGNGASATEIRVPEDVPTLQQAIARAAPGDTIVLAAGVPGGNVVPAAKRDITIPRRRSERGRSRRRGREHGILVRADGVSILNLGAQLPAQRTGWPPTTTGPRISRRGTCAATASTSRTASTA